LALHHLDRGQPNVAAGCFRPLLQHHRADTLPAGTLFHAALAFHRTGDRAGEEQAWKRLAAGAGDNPLRIGARVVTLEELRQELDREPRANTLGVDWPVFRGSSDRTANARGSTPLLEPRWQTETISEGLTRIRVGQ